MNRRTPKMESHALTAEYALLDFGNGRKLERFGDYLLDRESPVARDDRPAERGLWKQADARFRRSGQNDGNWSPSGALPDTWPLRWGPGVFELRPSPFGHIGLFPEQEENWRWIARQVKRAKRPMRVLNLFAYTGGSTLAAAAAGAEVTHVDAAKNVVARARHNAELSGMHDRPIRWITDDVKKFCQREERRQNKYDAVILDPPSYGHGAQGEAWKIGRDLLPLLESCRALVAGQCAFVLSTCHTPGIGPAELSAYLADGMFGSCERPPAGGTMWLRTEKGRKLPAGVFARWPG